MAGLNGEPNRAETSSSTTENEAIDRLIKQLAQVYENRGKSQDFSDEKDIYQKLLPLLVNKLQPIVVEKPFALGSTATVWSCIDNKLGQRRALKVPRPRLSRLRNIIRIVRAERETLAELNHQNLIRIYGSDEIEMTVHGDVYSFPYILMEYLEGVKDLDDYLVDALKELTPSGIVGYFRDVLVGVGFLHSRNVIHCDLKPGNILIAPGRPALVADLGYAKHLPKLDGSDGGLTEVSYTPRYAHPELRRRMKKSSDSAANVAVIQRDKLNKKFDLFALGRTIQEVLGKLRDQERTDPLKDYGRKSVFSAYQWHYLGYIAKRLLDGVVENLGPDDLYSDKIPGLPEHVMQELRYESADDALESLEKLLHLYDLEGEVPELNPNINTYIQIPHCRVPLTPRVKEILDHPTFTRLAQTTQLGFVSLVYPGATHTRFEHVLGTFAHCCGYIRALWYDQANALFQCIMSKKDIELGLLVSLLHDTAQYPMAHDLTEIHDDFAHEKFTRQALERVPPGYEESLAGVIRTEWGIEPDEILEVLTANENSSFRHRLLNSLIDGPIDCDKLDYLRRDSTHLGVSYGLAIDHERLLRNLTIAYRSAADYSTHTDGTTRQQERLDFAEVAVAEKALVVAQALWKTRRDMFTQVYWQHTTRAMKAMLAYVVRQILVRIRLEGHRQEFWREFQDYIFDPLTYLERLRRSRPTASGKTLHPDSGTADKSLIVLADFELAEGESGDARFLPISHLAPTDDSVLGFLSEYASGTEKEMIRLIRSRSLYGRLAVFSAAGIRKDQTKQFNDIYHQFHAFRSKGLLEQIEEARNRWENGICNRLASCLGARDCVGLYGNTSDAILTAMRTTVPLILVDIPTKGRGDSEGTSKTSIKYLAEELSGIHPRQLPSALAFSFTEASLSDEGFDLAVGKIRVLAHPQWRDLMVQTLTDQDVFSVLSAT